MRKRNELAMRDRPRCNYMSHLAIALVRIKLSRPRLGRQASTRRIIESSLSMS